MARGDDNQEPHPVDRHVGRRVQEQRLSQGFSQTALGKAVGVSFQQMQKYEKGQNRISASKLFAIADFLNVGIPYFFEGYGRQPGLAEETQAGFDHEHPATRQSLEIARLAPQLPLRKQKLILEMMREMLEAGGAE